ncbi:DUF2637 domain-containing protein [Nocardiopsis alba]|uniref:DUF2637 domain-containing protein n=1 Tax=Nocardiopsis alba TaxID=53437 RepID=UPI00366B7BA7
MSRYLLSGPLPPAPGDSGNGGDSFSEWETLLPLAPESAAAIAAVLGVLVLIMATVAVVRKLRKPAPTPVPPSQGEGEGEGEKKRDGWTALLLALVVLMTPVMLGLTFYGSFHAVKALASAHGVEPSWIPPLAIDGILLLFLFVDLLLARLDRMNEAVKATTRGFIALTLVANAGAGWPDPVAVLLHVPAPLALVVMTEVARAALLNEARDEPERFDQVPFKRWLLDPLGTASLRRWMILHHVTDYRSALASDMERRDALATLRALSPSQRAQVPGHLSRRLRQGMYLTQTVREVRMLAATVTAGFHLQDVRVVSTCSGASDVDGASTLSGASSGDGVAVHSGPTVATGSSTSSGAHESETAVSDVDTDVDTTAVNTPPTGAGDPDPEAVPTPQTALDVDGFDDTDGAESEAAGIHTHPVWDDVDDHTGTADRWRTRWPRAAHTADEAGAETPDAVTDGDEDEGPDPEDDGPRGGGAPVPADAVPGQITIADALETAPAAPGPLDVARVALEAPVWDEVADAGTAKDKVLSLMWEFPGDLDAVRQAYTDRTGDAFPRDAYRHPRPGKRGGALWEWHHTVTTYLIREYGHADTVRTVLADAGVDHDHEAVTAALDAWSTTNGRQVLQFRRPVHTGS